MKITQLLSPMTNVSWISVTDTVRDAFDHLETYDVSAAPVLDWSGRYLGTVTEADLRRHVASNEKTAALATPLSAVERRSRNVAVTVDREVESLVEQALGHRFIPVVDDCGRLLGIVDRRRILGVVGVVGPDGPVKRLPSAA
jgi:CBS domain-containing protein